MAMFRSTTPLAVTRSTRRDRTRALTSGKAGKLLPVSYLPLLREDRLTSMMVQTVVEMAETVRPLAAPVYARLESWFMPFAGFNRFSGLDDYNRSYAKTAGLNGQSVPAFIDPAVWAINDIYKTLGLQHVAGAQHNRMVLEAYNELINYMYRDRSPNLPQRTQYQTDLAAAFWQENKLAHIVPNFDRSYINGTVPVVSAGDVMVKGIGHSATVAAASTLSSWRESSGTTHAANAKSGWGTGSSALVWEQGGPGGTGFPNIRVTLDGTSTYLSLANIDLARAQANFDSLRKRYAGHSDADIIELLMEGIRVPEYMEREPFLLGAQTTPFTFGTRWATDAANLDDSVTNGVASFSMRVMAPQTNVGGIIMNFVSVVPEQMWERREDPFLSITDQDLWPKYERDTLDLDGVRTVLNSEVDTSHASPSGTFGYEAIGRNWERSFTRIGGRMHRPTSATAWSEERAMLWVTEPVNPSLTADFYLANQINADPFADKVTDHLTITTQHMAEIEGNTVIRAQPLEIV